MELTYTNEIMQGVAAGILESLKMDNVDSIAIATNISDEGKINLNIGINFEDNVKDASDADMVSLKTGDVLNVSISDERK